MKGNFENRDKSERLVIWRNIEKINEDTEYLRQVETTGKPMCREITAYPLQIDLNGDFERVCERIRQAVPMNLFSDKFQVGEYSHVNARIHEYLGTGVMRDFILQEKERLFEKTGGKITPEITLERDSFLRDVKVKDPFNLLESVHNFFITLKHFPESRQRCRSLVSFGEGELLIHPNAIEAVQQHHSEVATPSQIQFYEAVRGHIHALRAFGAPEAFCIALENTDETDLRWLNLAGHVTIQE